MFKYELQKDGVMTHGKTIDRDVENPWLRQFSNPKWMEHWGYDGSNHTIIKTEITPENDPEVLAEADAQERRQLKRGRQAVQDATTIEELKPVLLGILKHL